VEEAGAALAAAEGRAVPIAGGITFAFAPYNRAEELVSLSRLPLDFIAKSGKSLRVGAMTRINDLLESRPVASYADGILTAVASRIGSTLNRNLITVGGNISQPFIWCDLPVALMALKADIVTGGAVSRSLSADEFFARPPRQILKTGELVTEVVFPSLENGTVARYRDFTLTENDFALIKVAAAVRIVKGRCREISLVVGGASALPQRLEKVEAVVRGTKITAPVLAKASAAAEAEVRVIKDIRCTLKYKKVLCGVLVRDILERLSRGEEGGR